MYYFGEFFNLHDIPGDEFENRFSWKFIVAKKNYEKNIELFKERDERVLKKLKEMGSKYWIPYEELLNKKEYFPNIVRLYWESMKQE